MHIIKICQGGSCRRNFAEESLKLAEKTLGIHAGENTQNGEIRLETCGCLSNCELGPNVFIGASGTPLSNLLQSGTVLNHMTPKNLALEIQKLQE